jgi:hypothetical protein
LLFKLGINEVLALRATRRVGGAAAFIYIYGVMKHPRTYWHRTLYNPPGCAQQENGKLSPSPNPHLKKAAGLKTSTLLLF